MIVVFIRDRAASSFTLWAPSSSETAALAAAAGGDTSSSIEKFHFLSRGDTTNNNNYVSFVVGAKWWSCAITSVYYDHTIT